MDPNAGKVEKQKRYKTRKHKEKHLGTYTVHINTKRTEQETKETQELKRLKRPD